MTNSMHRGTKEKFLNMAMAAAFVGATLSLPAHASWLNDVTDVDVDGPKAPPIITQPVQKLPQVQSAVYFDINGQLYYGDAQGLLYPANPQTGQVIDQRPAGWVVTQNSRYEYVALDRNGQKYRAVRVQ